MLQTNWHWISVDCGNRINADRSTVTWLQEFTLWRCATLTAESYFVKSSGPKPMCARGGSTDALLVPLSPFALFSGWIQLSGETKLAKTVPVSPRLPLEDAWSFIPPSKKYVNHFNQYFDFQLNFAISCNMTNAF